VDYQSFARSKINNSMKTNLRVFWIGILIYTVSFCLKAVGEWNPISGNGMGYGFALAILMFISPLYWINEVLFNGAPWLGDHIGFFWKFSIFLIGWINPIFLITAFLELSEYRRRLFFILRIATFAILPFTWILFFQARHQVYPRDGYFLWILGMLLAMFPAQFSPSGPDIPQA
jgi:hypothetical protein